MIEIEDKTRKLRLAKETLLPLEPSAVLRPPITEGPSCVPPCPTTVTTITY